MAKKYNKITKEEVLNLFSHKKVINRAYICKSLGCSVYSVIQVTDILKENKEIKLTNHGYLKV